jgi:hypothetical protein
VEVALLQTLPERSSVLETFEAKTATG